VAGFIAYLKTKKYEISLAVVGFVLTTVILGSVLAVAQEWLKRKYASAETTAHIRAGGSSIAAFPSPQSIDLLQLLAYEVSASDYVSDVHVTVTFPRETQVFRSNVVYSIDVDGFKQDRPQQNVAIISLSEPLDVTKSATIYLETHRVIHRREDLKAEVPDIHVDGKDKHGDKVYR